MDKHMEKGIADALLMKGHPQDCREAADGTGMGNAAPEDFCETGKACKDRGKDGGRTGRRLAAARTGILTAAAVMLVMSAAMGTAWAYFTTYTAAKGSYVLHLGHEETVEEEFSGWQKILNVASTEDSRAVYVRARGYCADYDLSYGESESWTESGGWMYYTGVLLPGESLRTPEDIKKKRVGNGLAVRILDVPKSAAQGLSDGDSFNVILVYETMEVQYDAAGRIIDATKADWTRKVESSERVTSLGGDD